jgi:hypothetical protein
MSEQMTRAEKVAFCVAQIERIAIAVNETLETPFDHAEALEADEKASTSNVAIHVCGGTPSPQAMKEIEDFALYLSLSGRFAAKREAEITQLRADLAALVPLAKYARDCRSDFEVEWRAEYGDEAPELPSLAAGLAVLERYIAEVPRG